MHATVTMVLDSVTSADDAFDACFCVEPTICIDYSIWCFVRQMVLIRG